MVTEMSLLFRIPNGDEIRELRRKVGMTQTDLAREAGMSQSMIARIESGGVDPRLSTLKKILAALESIESPEIIAKHIMTHPVIHAKPDQTVREVIRIMQTTGFSQVPVLDDGKPIGSLEESVLLSYITFDNPGDFLNKKVQDVMEARFPSVTADTHIDNIHQLLATGYPAVLVVDDKNVIGIICKIDLIASASGKKHVVRKT